MSRMRLGVLLAACIFLVAGCYEDEAVITINRDGSGTIHQTYLLSEQMIVASSDGAPTDGAPAVTKERLLKEIGTAFHVTSLTVDDRADGSRRIEVDGTFDTPEQFFLSDFCRDQLNLRIIPTAGGKATVQCDRQFSGGAVSLVQFYGMAKGLHITRTIHLPATIEQTNGARSSDGRTVSWTLDLRDREGLARTQEFVEGPSQGKGIAVFDASALSFALPLQEPVAPEPAETENQSTDAIEAEVAWISVQRAKAIADEDVSDLSYTEIGVELTRQDTSRTLRTERPVWISLFDDTGADLIEETTTGSTGRIYKNRTNATVKLKAKAPSPRAKRLTNLQGYVEVHTEVVTETVTLSHIGELVGEDGAGSSTLNALDFKISGINGDTLDITINGGRHTIETLSLRTETGEAIQSSGGMGGGDRYSYEFREPIPPTATCELTVIVSDEKIKVPFALDEVALP